MSLPPVENPYSPFVGLTGIGLNDGALYIGVDGADPEVSPQQCYWDAAGTIPAAQPIDILGGYPMRLGTPAQVFTARTYSIRVRDRQGQQVFYLASAVTTDPPLTGMELYPFLARDGITPADLFDRFGKLLNVQDDFGASPALANNTTPLQEGINFARANGRRMIIPAGNFNYATGLTINNTTSADTGFILEGEGWGTDPSQGGSWLIYTGTTAPALTIPGTSANNQDGLMQIGNFGIRRPGGPKNVASQGGVYTDHMNNTVVSNLLVQDQGGIGFEAVDSFASMIRNSAFAGNYGGGVYYRNAGNRVRLENLLAFSNGRDPSNPDNNFNVAFGGVRMNLAPIMINCDLSYSGRTLFSWTGAGVVAAIQDITVSAGVATVQCAGNHSLTTGDGISVNHVSTAGLAGSTFAKVVTVVSPTAFTYVCSAANGVYDSATDPSLSIGVFSNALAIFNTQGMVILNHYCEDPNGHAAYIFASSQAITFIGGYVQSGWVVFDQAQRCEIMGMRFAGANGGLVTSEADQRPSINVHSSNRFDAGAIWVHGAYFMVDGQRYGPAIPVSGDWNWGETLLNSQPAVGQPAGWTCVGSGNPGTWAAMANLT